MYALLSSFYMVNKKQLKVLKDQNDILENDKATQNEVNDALTTITKEAKASITGDVDKDSLLVESATRARDSSLGAVTVKNAQNRGVTKMQQLFRDIAQEDDPKGTDPIVKKKLLKFDNVRLDQRYAANAALRSMSTLIIELQKTIVNTFEKDQKEASVGFGKQLSKAAIFRKFAEAVAVFDPNIDKKKVAKDVSRYLMNGDAAALDSFKAAVKGLEKEQEIVDNLIVGRGRLEGLKIYGKAKISDLGVILMKAAMAEDSKITEYKEGWFKALLKNPAHRGAMIDLNLDDGSGFLIYLPLKMSDPPQLIYGNTATYRGIENADKTIENQNKLELLEHLENPKDAKHPTASLVYAHVYNEGEVDLAFKKLPEGCEVKVNVVTDQDTTEPTTLVKKADKMEYKTLPKNGTAPDIVQLNANPCRWMDAATLKFVLNDRTKTKILND